MSTFERTPARQQVDAALALDREAFPEWWVVIEKRFRQPGIAERLFARAFAAGRAVGMLEGEVTINLTPYAADEKDGRGRPGKYAAFDPGPAGMAGRRAS